MRGAFSSCLEKMTVTSVDVKRSRAAACCLSLAYLWQKSMAVTDVQFASGRMSTVRIALANIRYATTPDESVALSCRAIHGASAEQAAIICFPECYVPGYRAPGKTVPPPDAAFLELGPPSRRRRATPASRWC